MYDVRCNEIYEERANYTWQDYKTNEDILTDLKINSDLNNIQNFGHKCINVHVQKMDTDRLSHLNHELSLMCQMKPGTTPLKTSGILM